MSTHAKLGVQLNWLEILDVFRVEEHVSDDGFLFVDFEWVAGQDDALEDYCQRVRLERVASCKEGKGVRASEEKDLAR